MENNFNIPKYRAKVKDREEYIVGFLIVESTGYFIQSGTNNMDGFKTIDPSTLAINFPDMLDSENNPIFASLSKCGKGGDIADLDDGHREIVFIWHKYAMCIDTIVKREIKPYNKKFISLIPQLFIFRTKIIGIQN